MACRTVYVQLTDVWGTLPAGEATRSWGRPRPGEMARAREAAAAGSEGGRPAAVGGPAGEAARSWGRPRLTAGGEAGNVPDETLGWMS